MSIFNRKNKTPNDFYNEIDILLGNLKEKGFNIANTSKEQKSTGGCIVVQFDLKTFKYDELVPQLILILNNSMGYSYPKLISNNGFKQLYSYKYTNDYKYNCFLTNLGNIVEVEFSCYDNKNRLTESTNS